MERIKRQKKNVPDTFNFSFNFSEAIRKFRKNKILAAFLRGACIAVIGMIFDVGISMGRTSVIDLKTCIIAAISIICLFKYKVNPIWILLGAGIVGMVT